MVRNDVGQATALGFISLASVGFVKEDTEPTVQASKELSSHSSSPSKLVFGIPLESFLRRLFSAIFRFLLQELLFLFSIFLPWWNEGFKTDFGKIEIDNRYGSLA